MPVHDILPFILCVLLFFIGVYAIVAKKNLVKIIVGVGIMEYAVNMFLVMVGYRANGIAPIITPEMADRTSYLPNKEFLTRAVDPVPQALVLTSIVIGLGIMALMITIALRLYEKYGTFDITEIRRLKG